MSSYGSSSEDSRRNSGVYSLMGMAGDDDTYQIKSTLYENPGMSILELRNTKKYTCTLFCRLITKYSISPVTITTHHWRSCTSSTLMDRCIGMRSARLRLLSGWTCRMMRGSQLFIWLRTAATSRSSSYWRQKVAITWSATSVIWQCCTHQRKAISQ